MLKASDYRTRLETTGNAHMTLHMSLAQSHAAAQKNVITYRSVKDAVLVTSPNVQNEKLDLEATSTYFCFRYPRRQAGL